MAAVSDPRPPVPAARATAARAAFARYRVMAFVTGAWLLLLCLELVLKYVGHVGGVDASGQPLPVIGRWVAFAHGWIYVVYLVTVVDLWSRMRWGLGRVGVMVVAGVVPVLSFVVERRAARWVEDTLRGAGAAPGAPILAP
jgi:integral membrane protein